MCVARGNAVVGMDSSLEKVVESGKKAMCDLENMVMCDCAEVMDDMPYNTGGCLRCPAMDASFYIQNFVGALVAHYD